MAKKLALAVTTVLFPTILFAATVNVQALNEIADYADRICIPKGHRTDVELKSDVDANLTGLAKRLFDLKVNGAGTFHFEEYSGAIQSMLKDVSLDPAKCRDEVARRLEAKVFQ